MPISSHSAQHDTGDPVRNAELAVADIKKHIDAAGAPPAHIAFFAHKSYEPKRAAALMRDAFPNAVTFGCASSGEICGVTMTRGAFVAMAFPPGVFEQFDITVLERLDKAGKPGNPRHQVEEAFRRFETTLGKPVALLDFDEYVGLAFADGVPYYVEPVLEAAGDLTSVSFIGGIAGDDGAFAYTPVFLNGVAYTDAVVLGIAKPAGKFALVKTQGLEILDKTFVVTGSDEEKRLVTHLDGMPAATALSEVIGVPEEKMDFNGTFVDWPFGLMAGEDPFLRVALERLPDNSLRFINSVKEGMRLKLGKMTDIVESTEKSLNEVRERLGGISAIFHINCMSRQDDLIKQGKTEAFGALFGGIPHAAFSSQGEIYIAIANETSIMLVFA